MSSRPCRSPPISTLFPLVANKEGRQMGRTDMMAAYDVLRLHGTSSLTRAEIAQTAGVSTGTVSNILARARDAGVSWPTDLDPAGLHRVLYPPVDKASGAYLEPDLESVEKALGKPRRDRAGTSDPAGSRASEPRRRAPRDDPTPPVGGVPRRGSGEGAEGLLAQSLPRPAEGTDQEPQAEPGDAVRLSARAMDDVGLQRQDPADLQPAMARSWRRSWSACSRIPV